VKICGKKLMHTAARQALTALLQKNMPPIFSKKKSRHRINCNMTFIYFYKKLNFRQPYPHTMNLRKHQVLP
jgi:hypothetical protein